MTICRVTGSIVSTHKNDHLVNRKIMIVQPLTLDGEPQGADMLAIDEVDAGIGDLVLVIREGGSARLIFNEKKNPVQAVIVGVVDGYHVEGQPSL